MSNTFLIQVTSSESLCGANRHRFDSRCNCAHGSHGFSLIELLVVIAIIGVLTAILIPATTGIRNRSTQLQCFSQLRNLHQATSAYQSENGGYLPPNHAHSGSQPDQVWTIVLRPYFSINDLNTYGAGTNQMLTYLSCPALPISEHPTRWWESNYSASPAFGTDGTPRNLNHALSQPSQALMFISGLNCNRSLYRTPLPWTGVAYPHNNRASIIFFDGHLETRTKEQIPEAINDDLWGLNIGL